MIVLIKEFQLFRSNYFQYLLVNKYTNDNINFYGKKYLLEFYNSSYFVEEAKPYIERDGKNLPFKFNFKNIKLENFKAFLNFESLNSFVLNEVYNDKQFDNSNNDFLINIKELKKQLELIKLFSEENCEFDIISQNWDSSFDCLDEFYKEVGLIHSYYFLILQTNKASNTIISYELAFD